MSDSRRVRHPLTFFLVLAKHSLLGLLLALGPAQLLAEDHRTDNTENGSPAIAHVVTQSDVRSGDPLSQFLPHNLSTWHMFIDAGPVVKTVITLLLLASLITWTIAIAKFVELRQLQQQFQRQNIAARRIGGLQEAATLVDLQTGVGRLLLNAVQDELEISPPPTDKIGIKERSLSRLARIEAAAVRNMSVGTGALASIGSTSPFVGLFGTVWGIMNAFIGISQAHTTNLAVIAPGLAEALLATALGLVAAVPAVLAYNYFTRRINTARALISDLSATLMQLLSRDLDRADRALNHS